MVQLVVAVRKDKYMTPMLKQYLDIKKQYSNSILFFRLGDFYEMFFNDAELASKELGLALTNRNNQKVKEKEVPMCGIPHHSADTYIARLIKKGYTVAICEQVEESGKSKTLLKREVIRVITPGTVLDESLLDSDKNNYITTVHNNKKGFGIATCDITTGEFFAISFPLDEERGVIDEISRISPSEIIIHEDFILRREIESVLQISCTKFLPWAFEYINAYKTLCDHFNTKNLKGFGIEENENCIIVAGSLLEYLNQTHMNGLSHISTIRKHTKDNCLLLDINSRNSLEIVRSRRTNDKKGSLLWVLDKTVTPMGARKLRKWVEEPLINLKQIAQRQDTISEFLQHKILKEELKDLLRNVKDMDRLLSKISYGSATSTDLLSLKTTLSILPKIKEAIAPLQSSTIKKIHSKFNTLSKIYKLIHNNIVEEGEGLIKQGVNTELDAHKESKTKGVDWLMELEENERNKTGIKNLKIKFSKVFGYCIEVSNSHKNLVPQTYIRRQTLTNAERYTTSALKELEEKILNAEDNIKEIESLLYKNILKQVADESNSIINTSDKISDIDALLSLAIVAEKNNYVRPLMNEAGNIDIKNGRHPVLEEIITQDFIPNDTNLTSDRRVHIITGPNMAGKSTHMRATALIVLMAHIGSFVPSDYATISIVDKIFTRIGASDDLATGQSTFMVEMNEVSNILNNATQNSLVILDEIGRGTSTYDGLCIAWAVIEHICSVIKCKTMFATHYHELTQIENKIGGVKNYCVPVEEIRGELVFLRKVTEGSIDKSYGIQVARLSGIPYSVTSRANQLMSKLMRMNIVKDMHTNSDEIYFTKSPRQNYIITELDDKIDNDGPVLISHK